MIRFSIVFMQWKKNQMFSVFTVFIHAKKKSIVNLYQKELFCVKTSKCGQLITCWIGIPVTGCCSNIYVDSMGLNTNVGPRTNNQMSILRVNRSKTKNCVLHNGMITWNCLPEIFKVNLSFSFQIIFILFKRNFYLEKY